MKNSVSYSSWIPNRPISKGAAAYHRAVVNASWHKKNISELIRIIRPKIKSGDVVVDFGAGTGASAIYFLQAFKSVCQFLLVDNSPSWLAKAYRLLHYRENVSFLLLEKKKNRYAFLDELIGKEHADHVVSANTVHLIPNIEETFAGIKRSLKLEGTFTFQSGNILSTKREPGILMIEDSINQIHNLAIGIIRHEEAYARYRNNLAIKIKEAQVQRRFVFPNPRPIGFYVRALKTAGFGKPVIVTSYIQVTYKDWLAFVRVRRLQAGILPEVGGKNPTLREERDRDRIITDATHQFFVHVQKENKLATKKSFTAQWIYVQAQKLSA